MLRILLGCILALLLSSRSLPVYSAITGDINNDDRIDLVESLYALQVSAGLYPAIPSSCILTGKGSWTAATQYSQCDVVSYNGDAYACTNSHTSTTFTADQPQWQLLSQTGPRGPKGDKGDQGDQGPEGPQGDPGPTYLAGTGLWLNGDTFEVEEAVVKTWATDAAETESFVRPVAPGNCSDGFLLLYNTLLSAWECIPYEPANSESSIRGWAREESYNTPAEVQQALSGLGYVSLDETSCADGYIPVFNTGTGWFCSAIPGGGGSQYWSLTGTAGTTRGIHYLGTSDGTGLDIRINALRAVSYLLPTVDSQVTSIPAANHSPNIVAGYSANTLVRPENDNCLFCSLYAVGRTIGGGGMELARHRLLQDFGTIGGGLANYVDGYAGVIAGGQNNVVEATHGSIGGGFHNSSSGNYSFVGGGYENIAAGEYSFTASGLRNQALGRFSSVAGAYARVLAGHESTFVWNSAETTNYFESTGSNQFLINASGGVGIGTNHPLSLLTVEGSIRAKDINGKGYAVFAESASDAAIEAASNATTGGTGLFAYATAVEGDVRGVFGISKSEEVPEGGALASGAGVHGRHSPASGWGRGTGVRGDTISATDGATGVYGGAEYGVTNGVYGHNASNEDGAVGVRGEATGEGEVIGVLGQSNSDAGWAVYADGNLRVTGDIVVEGSVRPTNAGVIAFGPEHWQSRLGEQCSQVKMDELGAFATITAKFGCYTPPELDTWDVCEIDPGDLSPRIYWPCVEPGVEDCGNGTLCGENTEKPRLYGGLARIPLEMPHGAVPTSVQVRWAISYGSPIPSGDSLTDSCIAALYARPASGTGWWGYPNKKDALAWISVAAENPNINDPDPAYHEPYVYNLTPVPGTIIDNTSYTYFLDLKVNDSVHDLYEVVIRYRY